MRWNYLCVSVLVVWLSACSTSQAPTQAPSTTAAMNLTPTRFMATKQEGPQAVAVDASAIYWTNAKAGTVVRLDKATREQTILASGQDSPTAIAVDDQAVYWINRLGGTLMRFDKRDQTLTTLATHPLRLMALALDNDSIYWSGQGEGESKLLRIPKAGGAPLTLASTYERIENVAVDEAFVYWTAPFSAIMKIDKYGAGQAIEIVKANPPADLSLIGRSLLVDSTTLYWVDQEQGVVSFPKDSAQPGQTPRPLFEGETLISSMALDGSSIYVTVYGSEGVAWMPTAGGAFEVLATAPLSSGPTGIALDGPSIYWAASEDGAVLETRK